jgi:hypothetical protein
MIPVMQTILSDSESGVNGDCLRACICSLLHLSIEDVPHFIEYKPNNGWLDFFEWWLEGKGLKLRFDAEPPPDLEFYMVWGTSPRGHTHSVIHSNGKLVHDPHPRGGDVAIDKLTRYVWLIPIKERVSNDYTTIH